jgi:hypothetical protein
MFGILAAKPAAVKCGEKINNKLVGREIHGFRIKPAGGKYFLASNGYKEKITYTVSQEKLHNPKSKTSDQNLQDIITLGSKKLISSTVTQ